MKIINDLKIIGIEINYSEYDNYYWFFYNGNDYTYYCDSDYLAEIRKQPNGYSYLPNGEKLLNEIFQSKIRKFKINKLLK